jgi:hypothetical protein
MTVGGFVIKEVAGVRIPDTALARAATTLAQEASSDYLFNHALRSYVFGVLAGKKLKLAFDPELFYVSAILHDLGLTPAWERAERFEVDGADAAREFCLKHNVAPEKAERVWDAIALHSTVGIPPRKSAEAALVQIGAGTDVFGFGVELLEMSDIQRVIAAIPRHGFGRKFPELLADLGRRKAKQHAFTFVAEVAREHVHGFPGPTYKELFAHWASVVEPGS